MRRSSAVCSRATVRLACRKATGLLISWASPAASRLIAREPLQVEHPALPRELRRGDRGPCGPVVALAGGQADQAVHELGDARRLALAPAAVAAVAARIMATGSLPKGHSARDRPGNGPI